MVQEMCGRGCGARLRDTGTERVDNTEAVGVDYMVQGMWGRYHRGCGGRLHGTEAVGGRQHGTGAVGYIVERLWG